MNKFKLLLVAVIITVSAGSAMAQKTGYIDVQQVVSLMPEVSKLQAAIESYQRDSLQPRFNYTLSQYQRKDSIVNGPDSNKTPAAVRAKMREEMATDLQELQNWQNIASQLVENKRNEFLAPIYDKAINAINAVSKESGYSYVYAKEALLVMPPADDLLPLVVKKLGINTPASQARPTAPKPVTTAPKK